MHIGLLSEKRDDESRTALSPENCRTLLKHFPTWRISFEPCPKRCFADDDYVAVGAILDQELRRADLLLAIKEVPPENLMPGRRYAFFSHTRKNQSHNQGLIQALFHKKITLLDYELLINTQGSRLIGFGYYAGVVGAYASLKAWLEKIEETGPLPPPEAVQDSEQLADIVNKAHKSDGLRVVISGYGRSAAGAAGFLNRCGLKELSIEKWKADSHAQGFCRLDVTDYARRVDGQAFEWQDFVAYPGEFVSCLTRYLESANIYLACHYWDPRAPLMFGLLSWSRMRRKPAVIGDISCDVPGSIPTTISASCSLS